MPFKPGQSGNPGGASKNQRPWTQSLQRALVQYKGDGVKRGAALRKIADKVVAQALDGDRAAIEEIANRLDGRPAQTVQGPNGTALPVLFSLVDAAATPK